MKTRVRLKTRPIKVAGAVVDMSGWVQDFNIGQERGRGGMLAIMCLFDKIEHFLRLLSNQKII